MYVYIFEYVQVFGIGSQTHRSRLALIERPAELTAYIHIKQYHALSLISLVNNISFLDMIFINLTSHNTTNQNSEIIKILIA